MTLSKILNSSAWRQQYCKSLKGKYSAYDFREASYLMRNYMPLTWNCQRLHLLNVLTSQWPELELIQYTDRKEFCSCLTRIYLQGESFGYEVQEKKRSYWTDECLYTGTVVKIYWIYSRLRSFCTLLMAWHSKWHRSEAVFPSSGGKHQPCRIRWKVSGRKHEVAETLCSLECQTMVKV